VRSFPSDDGLDLADEENIAGLCDLVGLFIWLDRVSGGFGGVGPPGRGGPPEGPVAKLVDVPAWMLLEPMVVPTLWTTVAQARPSPCFIGNVVLEVTGGGWSAADRAGTGGVPDLRQVPELDPGIMPRLLELVVAVPGVEGVDGDEQFPAGGPQGPGPVTAGWPVAAGRRERETGSVPFTAPAVAGVTGRFPSPVQACFWTP
jgi:hypothetical protein